MTTFASPRACRIKSPGARTSLVQVLISVLGGNESRSLVRLCASKISLGGGARRLFGKLRAAGNSAKSLWRTVEPSSQLARRREGGRKSERGSRARGRPANARSQLRHREITRWDSRRSLEEALTNDGGNFYYFRCRPIRAERLRPHESRRRLGCVLHTFCSSGPGAPRRAPPLTNGLGVLLDELFKVLPRRGRVVTLNKDKPRAPDARFSSLSSLSLSSCRARFPISFCLLLRPTHSVIVHPNAAEFVFAVDSARDETARRHRDILQTESIA